MLSDDAWVISFWLAPLFSAYFAIWLTLEIIRNRR
jgi:hypothetical protein